MKAIPSKQVSPSRSSTTVSGAPYVNCNLRGSGGAPPITVGTWVTSGVYDSDVLDASESAIFWSGDAT